MSVTNSHSLATATTNVVVIDDSEDMRLLIGLALERSGDFHVVADAPDGKQGVAAVTAFRPHLVLLDISMPVMDGLQALTLIREECPTAVVVMLSGFGDGSALTQRALAMGAHGYVGKGGGFKALVGQLRVIVADVTARRDGATGLPKPRPAP